MYFLTLIILWQSSVVEIVSKPLDGDDLVAENKATPAFQVYLDDLTLALNDNLLGQAVIFPEYTVAGVPAASENDNGVIIVSNETGGRTLATSDGTNWRRVSDGAVIS